MSKWYVGIKGAIRLAFKAEQEPTQSSHGEQFNAVVGPFRTKRGAMFHAALGAHNPHVQHVRDAERIAARLAQCDPDATLPQGGR